MPTPNQTVENSYGTNPFGQAMSSFKGDLNPDGVTPVTVFSFDPAEMGSGPGTFTCGLCFAVYNVTTAKSAGTVGSAIFRRNALGAMAAVGVSGSFAGDDADVGDLDLTVGIDSTDPDRPKCVVQLVCTGSTDERSLTCYGPINCSAQ